MITLNGGLGTPFDGEGVAVGLPTRYIPSRPPVQRIPRQAPRRRYRTRMSCCIAAACEQDRLLVTVSDSRVSWGFAATDEMLKLVRLQYPYWLAMIAGEDIAYAAESFCRLAQEKLAHHGKLSAPSVAQVRAALRATWRETQNEIAEAKVLGPQKFTLDMFNKQGRKQLGDEVFASYCLSIQEASNLRFTLLAAGFDEHKIPSLLICENGEVVDPSRAGYAAIGAGGQTVLTMLALQEYSVSCTLETAIYQICGAKFSAEKADGVSENTVIAVLNQEGKTAWIDQDMALSALRDTWKAHGLPRKPDTSTYLSALKPHLRFGTL